MRSKIQISAYNDHEAGRMDRLRLIADQVSEKNLPISAIHDHKGTLYVNWSETPQTSQLIEVMEIWQEQAEHLANHYIRGRELIVDVEGDNPFE